LKDPVAPANLPVPEAMFALPEYVAPEAVDVDVAEIVLPSLKVSVKAMGAGPLELPPVMVMVVGP
jgi:hypothetical protein